ncbi:MULTISPECIES: cystathionine beta-lyase [Rhodomicrobium]|uniref:cystathionine beta-lyase n=1 Tax=Rhodomicrobium TaxID=1068 RepID=UPI000B4ACBA3|nr:MULTISPECIES: cystathionine beta-lyase [Rhodomicrobium]
MAKSETRSGKGLSDETRLIHLGRDPEAQHGFVNAPIYRGSTVIFPSYEELNAYDREYTYGRRGTPTVSALTSAITALEGGARSWVAPSGLAAITAVLMAFVEAGDDILITDNVYHPTRRVANRLLGRLGVTARFYDPAIGAGIDELIGERTRLVIAESPGSQTLEMQDLPAIAEACRARGVWLAFDNTWATPLYFKPLAHGADISIQAATKYVVGHADAMLGIITANERAAPYIQRAHEDLGLCAGPEDCFLALRGLRTMAVRLARHRDSALEIAAWLEARPEVARVLHPGLPSHPGHALWKRDFTGSSGLFSVVLKPCSKAALAAMLDGLALLGMGYSWGGYESLIVPFDPRAYRSVTEWHDEGPALRLHIGLDAVDDLKADLAAGFARLAEAA